MTDGVAKYQEDWLEQIHQSYKKFNARAKIRNKETSSRFEIQLEAIRNNLSVVAARESQADFHKTHTYVN
jgi:hypothetical protein